MSATTGTRILPHSSFPKSGNQTTVTHVRPTPGCDHRHGHIIRKNQCPWRYQVRQTGALSTDTRPIPIPFPAPTFIRTHLTMLKSFSTIAVLAAIAGVCHAEVEPQAHYNLKGQ